MHFTVTVCVSFNDLQYEPSQQQTPLKWSDTEDQCLIHYNDNSVDQR